MRTLVGTGLFHRRAEHGGQWDHCWGLTASQTCWAFLAWAPSPSQPHFPYCDLYIPRPLGFCGSRPFLVSHNPLLTLSSSAVLSGSRPELILMLQKFIRIFSFTSDCHSLLFSSVIYHFESKVSSRYFKGEKCKHSLRHSGLPKFTKNFGQGSFLGSELKSPISQTFWASHQQPPYQRHIVLNIIYGWFIFIEENETIFIFIDQCSCLQEAEREARGLHLTGIWQ